MAMVFKGTRFKGGSWGYRVKLTLPTGKVFIKEKYGFDTSYNAHKERQVVIKELSKWFERRD